MRVEKFRIIKCPCGCGEWLVHRGDRFQDMFPSRDDAQQYVDGRIALYGQRAAGSI